jgi:adenylylsulfate kinase
VALATALGPESGVLVDMIARSQLKIPILTLDTGLLFPETLELRRRLEERYGVRITAVKPELSLEEQARLHGERLWERDADRCCALRKVEPLAGALRGLEAWISGIRREQTRERAGSRVVERDARFGLVKINPLAACTDADVWDYVRRHDVPVNALHARGYASIGCQPCTTPVGAGEDARAGRWRGRPKLECGLHVRPPAVPAPEPRAGGFILWFTGLSGAGKSTLANALAARLREARPVEILDGDEVRTHLSKGLGFSKEDRDTNIRRIGFVARLLARHGTGVITAAISPYAATRAEVREAAEREGIPFVEVFASASLPALAARDVKGLYKKALAGELPHFTGVSDPYEPPERPDVVARTDSEGVEQSLERILLALVERGLVGGPPQPATPSRLFPVFLKLAGRKVVLVGGGAVAASKLRPLLDAGADVTVVAPVVRDEISAAPVAVFRREFEDGDLEGAALVVAAATPEVNGRVRASGDARGVFVNAVDDPEVASAYTGGVLRKGGVTIAVSTDGLAPALAGLLREGLEAALPAELPLWLETARALRERQRAERVPMPERRPQLLQALNRLYAGRGGAA